MPYYEVVPATLKHAQELSLTLRKADSDEIIAQSGQHPSVGIGWSFATSEMTWAGLVDGKVACLFGVGTDGEVGVPWMLGSDLVEKHQRAFLRRNKKYIDLMLEKYSVLENYVDVRNSTSIRWLKWLGFDILPMQPHGPYGLPFHPFRLVRV